MPATAAPGAPAAYPYDDPRAALVLLNRRRDVAARYLRGETLRHIAAQWNVSFAIIRLDLQTIRSYWLQRAVRDFDFLVAEELAKIDRVEILALEGYERSCQPREVTNTEQAEGGDVVAGGQVRPASPRRKAAVRRDQGPGGNPHFLDIMLRASEERRKLLGLDAPRRFHVDWDSLTEEQLERLAKGERYDSVLNVTPEPFTSAVRQLSPQRDTEDEAPLEPGAAS